MFACQVQLETAGALWSGTWRGGVGLPSREEAAAAAVVPPHQSLSELTNLGPKMPHTMVAASDGDLGTSFGSVKSPRTDEDVAGGSGHISRAPAPEIRDIVE